MPCTTEPINVFCYWPLTEYRQYGDFILKGQCGCGHYVRNYAPHVGCETDDFCLWCDMCEEDGDAPIRPITKIVPDPRDPMTAFGAWLAREPCLDGEEWPGGSLEAALLRYDNDCRAGEMTGRLALVI